MHNELLNTFDEVVESRYHNKAIKIRCIVTGKTLTPYQVPKIIHVKCVDKKCDNCKLRKTIGVDIDAFNESILTFIDVKTTALSGLVKTALGVHCKKLIVEVIEMQMIERFFVARPTGKERTRKGGGSRPAYLIGLSIETNSVYELTGYSTVDPMTQSATHVFTSAAKVNNDIESFSLSTKKHSALNEFVVGNISAESMYSKLIDLYERYAYNITKIYERTDLHLVVDMLFRSVISFKFDNEFVHKGWTDAMIIGDTRCGKGYVAEKLVDYFGLGETVSGENCSFSGLVGGLQQLNKHWVITWGKIPMNDCGLLIVDETGGMEKDMWGKLSRIRSEGIAEITKIMTEVANARTRLLFICNAPNRTVASYSYGVQSISDMIDAHEDIARLDYALVVAHNEVKGEEINMARTGKKLLYDQKIEQELVLWCWSRKSDEVHFTPESVKAIYEMSLKLSNIYDFSIPLIQVENVRFKIAKVAIAFAARFYSNMNDGKVLVVKPVHVECAWIFFDVIYRKESSGYYQYSKMKKSEMEIATPEKLAVVEKYFNSWLLQKNEVLRCLLINNYIDPNDIATHLGVDKRLGVECVSALVKAGCLQKRGHNYVKSPEFNKYLKGVLLDRK